MKIAACLIVKNEARDIAEWLAYHAVVGIDSFLIYDNASTDDTLAVLHAASKTLDVRVVRWNSYSSTAQVEAYEHAMRTNAHEFDWIAVIDSDEFIVTHGRHTLRTLCETARNAAAIGINWAMFGSNDHHAMPPGLVIEAFTRRSEDGFAGNRHVKSIVRPGTVAACLNPHAFLVSGRTVAPGGSEIVWQRAHDAPADIWDPGKTMAMPDYSVAQINHYFTRSRAHWDRKIVRSYPNPASCLKLRQFDDYDRNEIEDRSALWAVDRVLECRAQILDRTPPQQGQATRQVDA